MRRPAVPSGRTVFAPRPGSVPIRALCSLRRYLPRLRGLTLILLAALRLILLILILRRLLRRRLLPLRHFPRVPRRRRDRWCAFSFRRSWQKALGVRRFQTPFGRYLRCSSFPPRPLFLPLILRGNRFFCRLSVADDGASPSRRPIEAWWGRNASLRRRKSATLFAAFLGLKTRANNNNNNNNNLVA